MVEIVFFIIFLFFAVLGLAEVLHILKCRLLKPKKDIISYRIIILTNDNPENQLLYAVEQCLWHYGNCFNLVAINSYLSLENLTECEKIAKKYDIYFCSAEKLANFLIL
ncbi:MAG: hypothetical protein IJP34_02435 [Clostridia bacterium]|nr:hypothetical protein [Clostridia bacterium]